MLSLRVSVCMRIHRLLSIVYIDVCVIYIRYIYIIEIIAYKMLYDLCMCVILMYTHVGRDNKLRRCIVTIPAPPWSSACIVLWSKTGTR